MIHPKKKVCACVRLILVLVWGTYYVQHTYVPCISTYVSRISQLPRYVDVDTYAPGLDKKKNNRTERLAHAQRPTHAQRDTEGVAAVSWIESLMIRRPFGSIDPNSIRETELHTECRRRHSRGESESLHSPQHDRVRDAARQRAAATRRMETDEARAERCVCV